MSLKTRYNLWKIKKSLTPSRVFKAGLFKKLSFVWDTTNNVKHAWYQTALFKHAAGFASVVLMAGSVGTGAYAYTSPEVTEGSVLYPIKEKLENIEEKIQITPEAKAKFYLKKIQRREAEREATKLRIEKTEKSIERVEERLENARVKVKERLKTKLEKRMER